MANRGTVNLGPCQVLIWGHMLSVGLLSHSVFCYGFV